MASVDSATVPAAERSRLDVWSLRDYLSSSGALLVVIVVSVFGVFLPALIIPYAFADDYPILFTADHLGSTLWFGDSVVDTVSASGRPLAGLLDQLAFSTAGTIDNLRFVRLVGVGGIALLALLLHWALVQARIGRVPAALIAVLMCITPAFLVYGAWAVLFNVPFAALLAGGASILSAAAVRAPRNLVLDRAVGAGALLLGAVLIYQPTAMFFWVFLAILLVGTVPDARRAWLLVRMHAGVAVVAFALAYVVRRLATHLADRTAPNAHGDVFAHDVGGKIGWFFHHPLYWSLNLFDLSQSPWLAAVVVTVAAVGIILGLRRRRAPVLVYLAIGLALVPLCLAPNLVVRGESTDYRMLGSLSALVVLYFCLGALCIWLAILDWLRPGVRRRTLVWVGRLGLAGAAVLVAAAAIGTAKNLTNLVVVPQNTELRMIRNQVAALQPGVPRIGYVTLAWNQGLATHFTSDEFIPSSAQPWTGKPAVLLTLRDEGRLPPNGRRPVVDSIPFETTAFHVHEPIVDLRKLEQLR